MAMALLWQKSSFSGGGDGNTCLEVAATDDSFMVRESDDPNAVLTTTSASLAQLLQAVRRGLNDRGRP
jgi:Domain of unknown function (DUF397)